MVEMNVFRHSIKAMSNILNFLTVKAEIKYSDIAYFESIDSKHNCGQRQVSFLECTVC